MAKAKTMTAKPTAAESIFDRFKRIADIKPVALTCKGWGDVFVLALTVAETEAANEADKDPTKDALAKAVIHTMCHADGRRVFDITNDEHIALIKSQPQEYLVEFLTKAQQALGVGAKGAETAKKD